MSKSEWPERGSFSSRAAWKAAVKKEETRRKREARKKLQEKEKKKESLKRQKEALARRNKKKEETRLRNEKKLKAKHAATRKRHRARMLDSRSIEHKSEIVLVDGKPVDRYKRRYIIYVRLKDGTKLYYADPYIIWTFNEYRAMQIYCKEYAQRYLGHVRNARPEKRTGRKKLGEIKVKEVKMQNLSKKYFMENVMENEGYFIRGVRLYRKLRREDYAQKKQEKQRQRGQEGDK